MRKLSQLSQKSKQFHYGKAEKPRVRVKQSELSEREGVNSPMRCFGNFCQLFAAPRKRSRPFCVPRLMMWLEDDDVWHYKKEAKNWGCGDFCLLYANQNSIPQHCSWPCFSTLVNHCTKAKKPRAIRRNKATIALITTWVPREIAGKLSGEKKKIRKRNR